MSCPHDAPPGTSCMECARVRSDLRAIEEAVLAAPCLSLAEEAVYGLGEMPTDVECIYCEHQWVGLIDEACPVCTR